MDYNVDNFYKDIFENAPEILKTPDRLKFIVQLLENKGYFVKYSSPGYVHTKFDNDRNDDGVINGKFATTARIIFANDYDFKLPAPKYWEWKRLNEGNDGLYTEPKRFSYDNDSDAELNAWREKYLNSLEQWVKELPYNKK